jgi:hypothetical protein
MDHATKFGKEVFPSITRYNTTLGHRNLTKRDGGDTVTVVVRHVRTMQKSSTTIARDEDTCGLVTLDTGAFEPYASMACDMNTVLVVRQEGTRQTSSTPLDVDSRCGVVNDGAPEHSY